MNLPDVPAEYYLCWSSIIIGISVPLVLVIFGLLRKDRRLFSLGFVAGSIFVFFVAYWYYVMLYWWAADYGAMTFKHMAAFGLIVIFGMALLVIGILSLMGKTTIGRRLTDWLLG